MTLQYRLLENVRRQMRAHMLAPMRKHFWSQWSNLVATERRLIDVIEDQV